LHIDICSIDFPNGRMCPIRYRALVQVFGRKSSVSKLYFLALYSPLMLFETRDPLLCPFVPLNFYVCVRQPR
jgi:hypothetical protein